MANKKQFLSVVAASILAASFTMTGCGSSSSSTPSSSSSSTSSVAPGVTMVKVSDGYVLDANVTADGSQAIEVGSGDYEFNATITGPLASVGGVNDTNGDGNATNGEPLAPNMKAPAGYTNINPFTTKLVDGEADMNTTYPAATAVEGTGGLMYNYDVVAAGDADLDVAKETAKAALSVSGYPGDGNVTSSSSSDTSSEASSSSVYNPYPAAARVTNPFPEGPSSSSEATSSEASSSSEATGGTAYAQIDSCPDHACINAVVVTYMGALNGVYDNNSSSSESNSSSSETSSEAASSSVYNPYPAAAL